MAQGAWRRGALPVARRIGRGARATAPARAGLEPVVDAVGGLTMLAGIAAQDAAGQGGGRSPGRPGRRPGGWLAVARASHPMVDMHLRSDRRPAREPAQAANAGQRVSTTCSLQPFFGCPAAIRWYMKAPISA